MKRDLTIPDELHPDFQSILETLLEFRNSIYDNIVIQLCNGECSYLHDEMYGYPYDYELYSKDSLDPVVQKLNSLLENTEKTFEDLINDNNQNGS